MYSQCAAFNAEKAYGLNERKEMSVSSFRKMNESVKNVKDASTGGGAGRPRFIRMQIITLGFILLLIVIIISNSSVSYTKKERMLSLIDSAELTPAVDSDAGCLLLFEENDRASEIAVEAMEQIFSQIRIKYIKAEAGDFNAGLLGSCDKAVIAVTHLNLFGESLLDIMDWVKAGGNLMIAYPPQLDSMLSLIAPELGIQLLGESMSVLDELHFSEGFLIGGAAHDFAITDPYDSMLNVKLKPECRVYAANTADSPIPAIWSYEHGSGKVVFDNIGFLEKAYRGLHCAVFSLMDDCFAWPVINASVFYIDDFPSPVPSGEGKYITRDYGMDIETFYTMVWWENIRGFSEKYGIRYTGLVIEQYSDDVEAPYDRNSDIARYRYFGNMLLDNGGEIGFHGYNHMPLCLRNFDFQGQYDSYKRWESYEDMQKGIQELKRFCSEIFPSEEFSTYVPPSNILSDEGRQMLCKDFPNIKAIASVYLPGDLAYVQEFSVAEDGIVETPRVIAGYIMDDFTKLTALCELNFHFVNSHFQHPDDVLDEDRGAAMGWPKLYANISEYMEWLYSSAVDIRNLTGVEMAGAVQRYDSLSISQRIEGQKLKISAGGFADEAWMMIRFNEGLPGKVTGGELTKQTDELYLLRLDSPEAEIEILPE